MPLPSLARPHRLALIALLAFLATLSVTTNVSAQDERSLQETADSSAIAVPFIGTYEVWCTDRNPSPNICGSHHGSPAIDIGMDIGTEIYAAGSGVVVEVEANCSASWCRGGAGLYVEIEHLDGTWSRYLHLSQPLVEIGDEITVGDLVGLAGNSGSARSPHLHYDEHAPRGTRTPMGSMLGCVNGEVVEYPAALGYESWNDVPFGTPFTNEGYECLGGAHVGPQRPRVLDGIGVVAISPPELAAGRNAELEITTTVGEESETIVVPAPRTALRRVPTDGIDELSFRLRIGSQGEWNDWSTAVKHVPADVEGEPADTCRGLFATATAGSPRIDVLIGTPANDMLAGGEGNDIICGRGGHDTISGGSGDDWIEGGDGRDKIDGGAGRDRLIGGASRDTLVGGAQRDRIIGGPGADTIEGGSGSDVLVGSTGGDLILGEAGRDIIRGGWGNDDIHGGGGSDRLQGNGDTDHIDGGSGIDSCETAEMTLRCE